MAVDVGMKLRLDKYLADMGLGTRSQVKKEIRHGAVTVNGTVIQTPETKISIPEDSVMFGGSPVVYETYGYYMLNKPQGVVSATRDRQERTVLDLLGVVTGKEGFFPVGRLDKDTEGLLLITNDGELAHRLLSPKRHVDKVYFVRVRGCVTDEDGVCFAQGTDIGDDTPTLPAKLEILQSGDISEVLLTIREGRFHQVKRMFQAVGKEVLFLKRLQMGTLTLDETLKPGEYRKLTQDEVDALCSETKKQ